MGKAQNSILLLTKRAMLSIHQRNVALAKVEKEANMDTSLNMVEVTATEDTKRNTTVIVTEAMGATNPNMEEDTKLNMEVVMAMSLPCMVVMSSLLTEDTSHRLMEATSPTEVPDTEVILWVMEAFRPLRFTGL